MTPVLHHGFNNTCYKRLNEVLIIIQYLDICGLTSPAEEHSSLDSGLLWPLEVVRGAASGCHVQRALTSKIASIENLEEIRFATTGGQAGAFGVPYCEASGICTFNNQIAGISALNPVFPVLGIENSIMKSLLSPPKPSVGIRERGTEAGRYGRTWIAAYDMQPIQTLYSHSFLLRKPCWT